MHHVDNFSRSNEYQFEIKILRYINSGSSTEEKGAVQFSFVWQLQARQDPPLAPAMGANYVRSRTKKD